MQRQKSKTRLWESLTMIFASLMAIVTGGYGIATANAGTINNALGIQTSSIERSTEAKYQYHEREFSADNYDALKTAYIQAAEEVEREGIVLLKNEGALPLDEGEKVSLFLYGSKHFSYSSSGSSATSSDGYANLKDTLAEDGISVDAKLWAV